MSNDKTIPVNTITIETEVSDDDDTKIDYTLRRKLLKKWGYIAKNNEIMYNYSEYHIFDFFIIFFTAFNTLFNFILIGIPDESKQYGLYIFGTINLIVLLITSIYNVLSNPPKRVRQANKIASAHWTKLHTDIMIELSKNRFIPDVTMEIFKFKYEYIVNNSPGLSKSKLMRFKREQLT